MMINSIAGILGGFSSISLGDMESFNLESDRRDQKYFFATEKLPEILSACLPHYHVLEVEGVRRFQYRNTYFDTADLDAFYQHHRGRRPRHKIRFRKYLETGVAFMEIKTSSRNGKTIKQRMPVLMPEDAAAEIMSSTPYSADSLCSSLEVNYCRISLLHKQAPEKVTFDTGLAFRRGNFSADYANTVFAEVKSSSGRGTEFAGLMKERNIREGSLSKYCMGIALTEPGIKMNHFKMILNRINKTETHAA